MDGFLIKTGQGEIINNPFIYEVGTLFGKVTGGDEATSLNITINNKKDKVALLVVFNRVGKDSITLDEWTYITETKNPSYQQYITIYKKLITSNEESYNLQTSSSERLSACLFYFNEDINVTFKEQLVVQSNGQYNIPASSNNNLILAVLSHVYVKTGSYTKYLQCIPPMNTAFNTLSNNDIRFAAFINSNFPDSDTTLTYINTDADSRNVLNLYNIAI